jgi:hypothetical protein
LAPQSGQRRGCTGSVEKFTAVHEITFRQYIKPPTPPMCSTESRDSQPGI